VQIRPGKIAVRTAIFQMPLIAEVRVVWRSGIRVLMPVSPAHDRITRDHSILARQRFSDVNRGVAVDGLQNKEVRLDTLRERQVVIAKKGGNIGSRFHLQDDTVADFDMMARAVVVRAGPALIGSRFIEQIMAWARLTK